MAAITRLITSALDRNSRRPYASELRANWPHAGCRAASETDESDSSPQLLFRRVPERKQHILF
ncbi:hypothetical protein EYF80_066378 [Liparis tanakae]|uniref:Uncharacterized protein n=1 Tax=Liparis tanakae TaxID=230148 RepID=A0A4Z2E445_9TELE|nr:hypothetical protein EYF80_066378 [Liparis tanakae]